MKIKKILLFIIMISGFSLKAFSSDYSNFKNADIKSIRAFTKDLGNVVGNSTLYSARALGFGGFDISYKGAYQIKPSLNDTVYEKNKVFGIDYIQMGLGLPYRLDTYIRYGGNDGLNLIGGGVRYGLTNVNDQLYKFNVMISLNYNMGLYKDFYILDYGAQLAVSMKLSNYVIPYVSGGIDSLKLKVQNSNTSELEGKRIYDDIERYTVGLRFKIKWFNISAAYDLYDTRSGFNASLGARF
jgi:hypothetical protein